MTETTIIKLSMPPAPVRKARPSGCDAVFKKYGQEIKVKDYVQAGRDGTEITTIVERKGGLNQLKAYGANSDTSDITLDMSLTMGQAMQQVKVARIVRDNITKRMANMKKEEKKEEKKGGEK